VDALHGLASLLHGSKGLAVDIGRFDGVDLLFQCSNLCRCLFQTVLMRLLPLERRLGRYSLHPRQRRQWLIYPRGEPTILICVDILSCDRILLLHLRCQVLLPFLQHIELRSQAEDGIFRAILLLLGRAASKPAPDARHVGCLWSAEMSEMVCACRRCCDSGRNLLSVKLLMRNAPSEDGPLRYSISMAGYLR
jgi:hypothetical protein